MNETTEIRLAKAPYRLPRYLGVAYLLLTAYACLWPFDELRSIAGGPLEFLIQPWPRYFILQDALFNIAGFVPLGFLGLASLPKALRGRQAVLLVLGACTLFSFGLEFCQNYLVGRVASNLDLACNALGGLVGALLALRWRGGLAPGGWVYFWRSRRLPAGRGGEIGILLILTWWLSQSEPLATLFNNGDLRPIFALSAPIGFSVKRYIAFEAASVACGLLAFGMFLRCGLRNPSPWLVGLLVLIGVVVKTLAGLFFVRPADPWLWAAPGVSWGLLAGCAALAACWRLQPSTRQAIASFALLLSTVLVNLSPGNPFEEASQHLIRSGHFTGFRGLTLALSLAWPFCALSWLALVASRRD